LPPDVKPDGIPEGLEEWLRPLCEKYASGGAVINCLMASKTTWNWASYFFSSSASFGSTPQARRD
jgi:hypothetical protein